MPTDRPNPDELLARVQAEESGQRRGKLKIFFGYAAGVGKTYAMLEAAQRERAEGTEVVVGYVEPHGRRETEALLRGLEALPPRLVPYRGVNLREFDLDAALARRPRLLLVDELAHTNAPGLRHAKRWQDVEELLAAGIDVHTTLNVQHVESINDVVSQITGVVVRETIPDRLLEQADEIELIDLTAEELMERLREGKVYLRPQAERALASFFQKANLQALRELSLRQTAHRLRRDVEASRKEKAATAPWATDERLLVCVGPSPTSAKLIRSAKRMAAAFGSEWLAVAVEVPGAARSPAAAQAIGEHLRLAERLGAETHTLVGGGVAQTLASFARERNVTKIVVGKTALPRWRRLFGRSVVDQLLEACGDIDIYVITGEGEAPPVNPAPAPAAAPVLAHYLATAGIVAACGLLSWLGHALQLSEANTVMVFLLGVAFAAARFGRGPAIFATVAGVAVFDFFFVPPYLKITVHDAQYLLTFAVMLIIGVIIATLTARLRGQLRAAQQLERRTAALYRLTRQMTELAGPEFLLGAAGKQLAEIFDGEAALYVREGPGPVALRYGAGTSVAQHEANAAVGQWVADHDQLAGAGTDTLPSASALFAPLIGSQRTVGAVGVRTADPARFADPEQRRLLETCASLIAMSLERDQSMLKAGEAEVRVQAEQLRNSLLSSVSHDLRTPLAAIAAASASLLEADGGADPAARAELLRTIADEAGRMTRLVENLLDMTRLEAEPVVLNRQWQVLEEIVGSALGRLRRELAARPVQVRLPADLPLLRLDGVLMEQVFVNLLENACRYAPAGSRIEIAASRKGNVVEVVVADEGPGLPPGSEARVFEKFFRAAPAAADGRRGVGLGLAICASVVQAHGGTIGAANRPGGGAQFTLRLPCGEPPQVALDEAPAEGTA